MINLIKDDKGNVLKAADPGSKYIIEQVNGSMTEVADFKEGVASILGREYLDCETADTEWLYRVDIAKKIGLMYVTLEDDPSVIVYDERIGKLAYSYTDPNPDYKIPENPKLIRVECNDTFLLTLLKLGYIRIWERVGEGSEDFKEFRIIHDVDQIIEDSLVQFHDKIQQIPLHEHL